ncbi:GAF domain-containing protein [Nakamurella flava]|uniref:histidine kinase n=1 Tax=Nakamurella flava TaxID=2576308 RepID=A0A4U6QLD5_9ACTN|nr:ATP-binding protein [Nakamurella flava]TKV61334.1 GAF domain-containing protein [Nakamurella flava]
MHQDSDGGPTAPPPVIGGSQWTDGSGWQFDRDLLMLWGVEQHEAPSVLVDPVLPVGGPAAALTWETWMTGLGPAHRVVTYRIVHGSTGEPRHLQAVVRPDGASADRRPARAWHMDVTASVDVARLQERSVAQATTDRLLVLGQVGAAMAASARPGELLHRITRLVAASLGGSAHMIVLNTEGDGCDYDIVAPPDPRGVTVDRQPADDEASMPRRPTGEEPGAAGGRPVRDVDQAAVTALPRSCQGHPPSRRSAVASIFSLAEMSVTHHLTAPIRLSGRVAGALAVFRPDTAGCFDPADQGLLQVLADGAGAAVAQARARRLLHARAERLHRLVDEREDLREQRDELLEQLEDVEDRERSLVAEVVHDDPLQLIVAATLRLDLVAPHLDPGTRDEIERSLDLLEQAGQRLRDLMKVGLTPPDLRAGLWPAIREIAQVLFMGTGVRVTVRAAADPLLPAAASTGYRVVREAIMNTRRHAQARQLTVAGERRGPLLVVVVQDDGIGCDRESSPDGHFGISTMRARAEAYGGTVTIRRRDGGGCEVQLELPDAFAE